MRILAIAFSGLQTARTRLAAAAENTVHILDRGPKEKVFHARSVTAAPAAGGGVVAHVGERNPAVVPLPDPGAPAGTETFAPNVDPAVEAVEMIRARAAFAAAARLVRAEDERQRHLLDILEDGGRSPPAR